MQYCLIIHINRNDCVPEKVYLLAGETKDLVLLKGKEKFIELIKKYDERFSDLVDINDIVDCGHYSFYPHEFYLYPQI